VIEKLDRMYTLVWREHDLDTAFEGLPDDFEWIVPGFPGGERARGPRATMEFFRDWISQWDDLHVEWELQRAGPDTVLAIVETRGRGRASGVPVELRFAQVWSYAGGRPRSMVVYPDVDEARRKAGP
jgi:ketosteroid isomerase-like protein